MVAMNRVRLGEARPRVSQAMARQVYAVRAAREVA